MAGMNLPRIYWLVWMKLKTANKLAHLKLLFSASSMAVIEILQNQGSKTATFSSNVLGANPTRGGYFTSR